MHKVAVLTGVAYQTAEKFLAAKGIKPVGEQRGSGRGTLRFYDGDAVKAALPSLPEYQKELLHKRALIANRARTAQRRANGEDVKGTARKNLADARKRITPDGRARANAAGTAALRRWREKLTPAERVAATKVAVTAKRMSSAAISRLEQRLDKLDAQAKLLLEIAERLEARVPVPVTVIPPNEPKKSNANDGTRMAHRPLNPVIPPEIGRELVKPLAHPV